jgi:hypothetical protein
MKRDQSLPRRKAVKGEAGQREGISHEDGGGEIRGMKVKGLGRTGFFAEKERGGGGGGRGGMSIGAQGLILQETLIEE